MKGCLETETGEKRINESSGYILNNWDAARVRINREKGIVGRIRERVREKAPFLHKSLVR